MCKIWENKNSVDISEAQLEAGIDNPLFSEVKSVGINGGEPTLRNDLPELVDVLFRTLPKLKVISLITNGYKYNEIIQKLEKIADVVKKYGGHFDVMVSLDGVAEVHDAVRGRPGNFERAVKVIRYAKLSADISSVRVGCTVIRENVHHLMPLLSFCEKEGVYVKYRLGVPHKRLYTSDLKTPYEFSVDEKYEFIEFLYGLIEHYESNESQKFFYQSLIGQLTENTPRRAGCDWKHRGVTITSTGQLLYCAVQSDVIASEIWSQNSEVEYFLNSPHLENIKKTKCDDCHHDYVGLPSARDLRIMYFNKLVKFSKIKSVIGFPVVGGFLYSSIDKYRYYQRKRSYSEIPVGVIARSNKGGNSKKIIICGWYGTETLGDKAILAGVISALVEVYSFGIEVTVASHFCYVTEMTKVQMPEIQEISVISVAAAIADIANYDHLVFGGGPLMNLANMAEMKELFDRAKHSGLMTTIAGCGVGPVGKKYVDKDIAGILNVADHVVYRDERSSEIARSIGVNTEAHKIGDDPAFTWLFRQKMDSPARSCGSKVLLLGLREFPYRYYASDFSLSDGERMAESLIESIRFLLKELLTRYPNLVIRPLPMCTNHYGADDRWFYKKLFQGMSEEMSNLDCTLLGREMAPEHYYSAFKAADFGIMMRYHSVVFSVAAELPCLVLDYTLGRGKVASLIDKYELNSVDLECIETAELLKKACALIEGKFNSARVVSPKFSQVLGQLLRKNL